MAYDETSPGDVREEKMGRAFSYTVCPIKNESGDIKSIVEYGADITDFRNAKMEAEAANLTKSEFLANMSHEIRTPMNGIMGMTDLLLNTELSDTQENYLEMIQKSSENLLEIINDILDISKIEAGKIELENIDFNLYDLLNEITCMIAVKGLEKEIEIRCEIEKNVPVYVKGDPVRLKQILSNLTSNAVKFTDQGEVIISAMFKSQTYSTTCLKFSVKDSGIGISDDKKKLLFDKFTQADTSTTRNYGGTGLGLAISKHLVEMMNGEIGVASKEGEGSEFWFNVCLEKSQKPYIENTGVHATTTCKNKNETDSSSLKVPDKTDDMKILVVEDNLINQKLMEAMLKQTGYESEMAANGEEALEKLASVDYDLVFMDVQMPIMDGLAATRQIRSPDSRVLNHGIPVIAMTAHAMKGDMEQCLDAGMNDYISKPISLKHLSELMQNWTCQVKRNVPPIRIPDTSANPEIKYRVFAKEKFLERTMGEEELSREIRELFIEEMPELLDKLVNAAGMENTTDVAKHAHSIKGIAVNIGGERLASTASGIEMLAKFEKTKDVLKLIPELEKQYTLLAAELEKL
ncbi:MAG: ATP-binding protein [Methanolobus sp.]